MGRYHTIRKSVDAVRWNGSNRDEVVRFAGSPHMVQADTKREDDTGEESVALRYFDIVEKDWTEVASGLWIVRNDEGVVTLMTDDDFTAQYEPVQQTRDGGEGGAMPPTHRAVPRTHGQVVPEHTRSGGEIPQAILDANSERHGA